MRLSKQQLFSLVAVTQKGFTLGKVCDIVFDTEGQMVAQYCVCPSWRLLKALSPDPLIGKQYLVSRDQVIKITDRELIVRDGSVKELLVHEEKFLASLNRLGRAPATEPTMRDSCTP